MQLSNYQGGSAMAQEIEMQTVFAQHTDKERIENKWIIIVKRFLKVVAILLLILIVIKWSLLLLAGWTITPDGKTISREEASQVINKNPYEATIDFSIIRPIVAKELLEMESELEEYRSEQLSKIKAEMVYHLKEEDGFLDWLYGWWTGYKIAWHSLSGLFDEKNDAKTYIVQNFTSLVIKKVDIERYGKQIESFTAHRIEDFYRSVIQQVNEALIEQSGSLNIKKGEQLVVDAETLPWGKYIGQGVIDIGSLAGAKALTGSLSATTLKAGAGKITLSKIAEGKVVGIVSGKVTAMVGAKAAGAVVSVAIDTATLGLGILIDYLFSKGYEAVNRDADEIIYSNLIDDIVYNKIAPLYDTGIKSLLEGLRVDIDRELKKNTVVKIER